MRAKAIPLANPMSLRVYHADTNPRIDPFSFRQSNNRAAELVARGEGRYITLSDGRQAVQLYRCRATRDNSWIERIETLIGTNSGKMPPLEVPGVFFRPPESTTWKLAHRVTILPSVVAESASA
jgi:hypothetical protein